MYILRGILQLAGSLLSWEALFIPSSGVAKVGPGRA